MPLIILSRYKKQLPSLTTSWLLTILDHSSDYLIGDARMVASTRLWKDDNFALFVAEVEEWEKRSASQYILLYGERVPGASRWWWTLRHNLLFSCIVLSCVLHWKDMLLRFCQGESRKGRRREGCRESKGGEGGKVKEERREMMENQEEARPSWFLLCDKEWLSDCRSPSQYPKQLLPSYH